MEVNKYIYDSLKVIYEINDTVKICIYEPLKLLFAVKKADLSQLELYNSVKKISNPHIAAVKYIEVKDCGIEIVREYVSGSSLSDMLKNGALPEKESLDITSQICDGLSALHSAGLVHRDINPNNIIITPEGYAKIIDFGIMRSFGKSKSADTVILGTPGYAAPEQFGFTQSDGKTDIYAVGVLLNVMLTGKLPSEKIPGGNSGKIIRKCIEMDAKNRFASVAELEYALGSKSRAENILKGIPGLRSGKPWLAFLSAIAYSSAALLTVGMFNSCKSGKFTEYVEISLSWIMIVAIPYVCIGNLFRIRDKLPFSKKMAPNYRKTLFDSIGVISLLIGFYIFGTVGK